MKRHLRLALGLLLIAGALAGCGKTTNSSAPAGGTSANGTTVDQAQVNDAIANNPGMVDEDVYQNTAPMSASEAGSGFNAITPLHWWRSIRSVDRSFDTQFSDPDSLGNFTLATVTIRKHLLGSFNILIGDSAVTDSGRSLIRKPLDDRWVRKILLRRVREDSVGGDSSMSRRAHWRIIGTSGAQVTAKDAVTRILSVRIQAGAVDTLITDPLLLHRLRKLIWIAPNTQAQITVTTNSADNLVFLYHHDSRSHFHANGDGTFSTRWTTSDFGGLRHFGVDAIAHATLYDDAAAYDSQAWIIPFAVRGDDRDVEHDSH